MVIRLTRGDEKQRFHVPLLAAKKPESRLFHSLHTGFVLPGEPAERFSFSTAWRLSFCSAGDERSLGLGLEPRPPTRRAKESGRAEARPPECIEMPNYGVSALMPRSLMPTGCNTSLVLQWVLAIVAASSIVV
jgi:hypothetical protein